MMEGSVPSMCVPTAHALGLLGVNFTEHCDIAHTHACALHGGSDKIGAIRIRDCVLSGEVSNRN